MRLIAVGDLSFSGGPGSAITEQGVDYPFAGLAPLFSAGDMVFANLESTFIDDHFPADQRDPVALAAHVSCAEALRPFHVLNLASNHVMDAGSIGLETTQRCLRERGILFFGAGLTRQDAHQPLITSVDGMRIGFLGYQEDCNYTHGHEGAGPAYLSRTRMLADLADLRAQVDIVIVSMHADLEFMDTPAPWRRALSRELIDHGATIILHTHTHVPQGVEAWGAGLIAYGLGNCLFDIGHPYMRSHAPGTTASFALEVEVDASGVQSWTQHPFMIGPEAAPRPMLVHDAERSVAMQRLVKLNAMLSDDALVLSNWREVCRRRLQHLLNELEGRTADEVIDHHAWILSEVLENRHWLNEIAIMGQEAAARHRKNANAHTAYRRPSWAVEQSLRAMRGAGRPSWP